ncbi:flavodoxin family protein [Mycolicibacterium flavescens]|uniref:NAD(P)H dehydrogenase n=1 Tax=Mycolicibacterium flavescens TaxID=1776 RepID=A0A1E3RB58_MYCFV|nr:flavodoxin family protein [Mycolicibacterium flavescens]MCV7278303.1 flavodoxin family protein [Mycolicibacterium flavescens]ODQ87145.1 NAD(P)H dehydrogenase [Mycolicibacterium flavescens]
MKVLVISASPRADGNSHLLAEAALDGARAAGHDVAHVFLDDYVERLFGNCRTCRLADGRCSLDDRYEDLLLNRMLPADGIIFAMPLYFYGMPGRLKTVFDRLFCYISNSAPQQARVMDGITGKKVGVLISSEENYVGATAGVVAQFQEATRYLHQELVGVVVGNGNVRGEIARDPSDPVGRARELGARLFDIRVTDYRLDTVRPNAVWECPAVN